MLLELRTSHLIGLPMALMFSVSAYASASRTFVATTGNDANTAANCGAATPCRSFGAALGVTNSGGELVVLNSGGYGPATISQSVTITATGVDASISVTTENGNGLNIDTPGNVTINGLSLHGEATGGFGLNVTQVGYLRLYNMLIENFKQLGVYTFAGTLEVYGCEMNDNPAAGLSVGGGMTTVKAYVASSSFSHNGVGAGTVGNSIATFVDSSAVYNTMAGFETFSGELTLVNSRSAFNNIGMFSNGTGGAFYFVNCIITNNVAAYSIETGGTMAGTNPGTSFLGPGQGTIGTLSTAVALQ